MLMRPMRWLRRPPIGAKLNPSSPFARGGVKGVWLFNEGSGTGLRDLSSSGNFGTFAGAPSWALGPWGSQLSFPTSSDYVVIDPVRPILGLTFPYWQACIGVLNSDSAGYAISAGSSSASALLALYYTGTSLRYWVIDDVGGGGNLDATTSVPFDLRPHLCAAVSYGPSSHAIILDGVTIATNTVTISTMTLTQMTLGALRSTGRGISGQFPGSLLWGGSGSGAVPDFAALWANFWSPYQTPNYRRWFAPSAVAGSKLFRPATLSLGAGGPFFSTPANG